MSPSTNEQRLHRMMEQVEEAKERLSSLKGERKQLFQQLKALGADDEKHAKQLVKKAQKEIEEKEAELERILNDLEKNFDWD